MTDPELTPAQEEAVRRLLADARHDEPMPDEVSAQLDDVLTELQAQSTRETRETRETRAARERSSNPPQRSAETQQEPYGDNVTPLRRRSRASRVLLAAAAVAAIGFGVAQVLPSGEDGAGDAGGSPALNEAPPDSGEQESGEPGSGDDSKGQGSAAEPSHGAQPPPAERRAGAFLAPAQARRWIERMDLSGLEARAAADDRGDMDCGPPLVTAGERRALATFDGSPALVVFHRVHDGQRVAEVYACGTSGGDAPLASTTVPAP